MDWPCLQKAREAERCMTVSIKTVECNHRRASFPRRGWNQIMSGRKRHNQGRHGEEVALSGTLESSSETPVGGEGPRTAHAWHTSHLNHLGILSEKQILIL